MDNEIEKMTAKERTMKQLEDGIKSVLDSESFAHWCEKQSSLYFNKYSFRNAMLVFLQMKMLLMYVDLKHGKSLDGR